ncbi:DUF3427 domain-containing protein [Enhygromyxa salina]|uniref:DUF3427 domain-containing protein n=1 Tax=Enhygromyxa salina TaxID=215803 RepID=UPI0011BA95F9|nr:DUF3427 domain-containing protein [Enhygromyxa salina]
MTRAKQPLVPGLYESLVDADLDQLLADLDAAGVKVDARELAKLDDDQALTVLLRYLNRLLGELLQAKPAVRLQRTQAVLVALDRSQIPEPARALLAVADARGPALAAPFPEPPQIPLGQSDLLINASRDINIHRALESEIASADRVDLIIAFVRRSGVKLISSALRTHVERRGRTSKTLRVITSTYLGVSEPEAIEQLVELGAMVRVGYDPRMVKLHAKAWIFHRNSGASTAYVGSSNLSRSAMVDGCEWNVRLAALESPGVVKKLADSFDVLWEDSDFQRYDAARFTSIRARERKRFDGGAAEPDFAGLDIQLYPFQAEILERLQVERDVHGRHANLVVAATGTGKTVIAAFDYKRLRERLRADQREPTLLFVAHREELLRKARATFRAILREPEFGELLVGGEQPSEGRFVFASIQSLRGRLEKLVADEFAVVIVDEFHHAEAPSYRRLLDRLQPVYLLGLTATPERSDGGDVLRWFGDRIAAEIRLWDALTRELLCPFHYFGVADSVDLSGLKWARGGYDRGQLESVFDGNDARELLVRRAIREYVPNPERMKALGFCVGIRHAHYMARRFCEAGIPARAVTGELAPDERARAIAALTRGELRVLFCVDVFNEGVDIPEVDTLLLLRPTESATLFLQQLGRGLRRSDGKDGTTVLDFIGNGHSKFRFDRRYRALLAGRGGSLIKQIEQGFPHLPPGCAIRLESQATKFVLDNVKRALANHRQVAIDELSELARGRTPKLGEFLEAMEWELGDLYRRRSADWTWTGLRAAADLCPAGDADFEELGRAIGKLTHVQDELRTNSWITWLASERPPRLRELGPAERRLLMMLLALVWVNRLNEFPTLSAAAAKFWRQSELRRELVELLELRRAGRDHSDLPLTARPDIPLRVHARYHVTEILAACGVIQAGNFATQQSGVRYVAGERVILNLVTINKDPDRYSPGTRYRDFAISPERFHSESPNSYSPDTAAGRRLLDHAASGVEVLLFVRETPKTPEGFTTSYVFLGPTKLREHAGAKPIALTWTLEHEIPAWFYPHTQLTSS